MGAPAALGIYRPRQAARSPFYRLVENHFDEFERVYSSRYQNDFGFWRPVIREVADDFRRCGVFKHGFARARCRDCGHDFLVAFSCKKRCFCPSCHQKRVLIFSERLSTEICAAVPHRQFVFTIPKRFRIYFRFNRALLGKMVRAAWEVVREVYGSILGEDAFSGVVASIQTFGELIHWHPHIHALATDGAFTSGGDFRPLPKISVEPFLRLWEHKIYRLLLDEDLITQEIVAQMQAWRHSGFSVHRDVHLAANDKRGIENLAQYIARCPFSLARILKVTPDGNVVYKAEHAGVKRFPHWRVATNLPGMARNFEVFSALDFLAQTTQHIPNRSQHLVRYYGWYSNKARGVRKIRATAATPSAVTMAAPIEPDPDRDEEFRKAARRSWARLIKKIYEVDPLICPACGGMMEIIAFITAADSIRKILAHIGHEEMSPRAPPPAQRMAPAERAVAAYVPSWPQTERRRTARPEPLPWDFFDFPPDQESA